MFARALELAANFTSPLIMSKRLANGKIACGCVTFIIVNADGWILTAAHVLEDLALAQQHQTERERYEAERQAIVDNKGLLTDQRRKKLARLQKNSEWITNISYWWGYDGAKVKTFNMDRLADLAVGRI